MNRRTWSLERVNVRLNYLDKSNKSTRASYRSGLNAHITFCEPHNFDLRPTPDTLGFFDIYMTRQSGRSRKLRTITSYLTLSRAFLYPDIRNPRKRSGSLLSTSYRSKMIIHDCLSKNSRTQMLLRVNFSWRFLFFAHHGFDILPHISS